MELKELKKIHFTLLVAAALLSLLFFIPASDKQDLDPQLALDLERKANTTYQENGFSTESFNDPQLIRALNMAIKETSPQNDNIHSQRMRGPASFTFTPTEKRAQEQQEKLRQAQLYESKMIDQKFERVYQLRKEMKKMP